MLTKELLERLCPTAGLNPKKYNLVAKRDELVSALNKFLPAYEINNHRRVSAFLACCGIETDYFRTTREYASGADYEGRKKLGNFLKGDGKRFPGRSIIQTTGRYNYWRVVVRYIKKLTGKDWSHDLLKYKDFGAYLKSADYDAFLKEADRLGVNFLADPIMLEVIETAVEAACIFWQEKNLNSYADHKQFKQLNGVVNRGSEDLMPLHWAKRNELYSKCIRYIPTDFQFANSEQPAEPVEFTEGVKPIEITPDMEQKFSSASATLQNPSFKTVAKKVGWRVGGALSTAWATTAGKIFLILGGLILLYGIGHLAYSYRKPIQLGWQIAIATFKKKAGLG